MDSPAINPVQRTRIDSTGNLVLGPPKCVAHVDLDCFYCQVEIRRNHELKGKPVAVVQYNPWEQGGVVSRGAGEDRIDNLSNGSLIAVSYEARAKGVKRNMRGRQARRMCPDLTLVQVPTAHGKSDMQLYREAGSEVAAVLAETSGAQAMEKASVDEVYIDITEAASQKLKYSSLEEIIREAAGTHMAGGVEGGQQMPGPDGSRSTQEEGGQEPHGGQDWLVAPGAWLQRAPGAWDMRERLLMAGCAILAASRAAVLERTGFTCSAGVADNKLMAKLCSGMHKPNQQTVLTRSAVPRLMAGLPVDRIRGLGGKLGARVLEAGISTVGDLAAAGSPRLRCLFGDKTGQWLHRMAHGLDDEPVKDRRSAVSVSGEKRYDSGQTITSLAAGQCAIRDLAGEISERLAVERVARRREPHTLTLGISAEGESNSTGYASRSCACRPGLENLVADAYGLLRAWAIARGSAAGPLRIHGLALSATGFKPLPGDGCQSLSRFLYPETPQSGRSMDLQDASDSSLPSRGTGLGAGSLLAGLPPSPQIVVREPPRHQGLKRGCPWSPTALPQKQSMAPGMDSGPSGILECEDTAIITPGPPGSRLKDESTFGPDAALRPDGNNGPPTSDTGGGSSYPLAPLARAADEVKNCHGNLILSLRREDLDESVLRELPVDIRMEVLAATDAVGRRPAARNEATKRKRKSLGSHASTAGRSIKSFFTPSKGRNGA